MSERQSADYVREQDWVALLALPAFVLAVALVVLWLVLA